MNHAFVCQIKGLQSITFQGSLVQQHYRIKQEAAIHLLFVLNTTKKKERKKENDWDRAPFLSRIEWTMLEYLEGRVTYFQWEY